MQFRFQLLATRLKFLRLLFGGLARLPFGLFAGQQFGFYLRAPLSEVPTALHRATLGSVARLAVLPMQDLLELGSEARFNTPGTSSGNWRWQMPGWALAADRAEWFARLNQTYGRV